MRVLEQIRNDEDKAGLLLIPLLGPWGLSATCCVENCNNRANTILIIEVQPGEKVRTTICDECFMRAKTSGRWSHKFTKFTTGPSTPEEGVDAAP